jgi:hypothetical protein
MEFSFKKLLRGSVSSGGLIKAALIIIWASGSLK